MFAVEVFFLLVQYITLATGFTKMVIHRVGIILFLLEMFAL